MSARQRSLPLPDVISSQESEAGNTPCTLQDGRRIEKSGQGHVPANRSRKRAKKKAKKTPVIYGPTFDASSPSAALQRSLESRLRALMDANGSPEYVMKWKTWDMSSGPPICALRASQRRTRDNDFSGWPTPAAQNAEGGANPNGSTGEYFTLQTAAKLAGWPSPNCGGRGAESADAKKQRGAGGLDLQSIAKLSGWSTPTATDANRGVSPPRATDTGIPLTQQAALAGWATPRASDADKSRRSIDGAISEMNRKGANNDLGTTSMLSLFETENSGGLNPELSRWLMGFPEVWDEFAPTAMPSSRKSQRNSSRLF